MGERFKNDRLINPDLAPVPLEQRTWNLWHIAALWVGMSVCIPTYMLASSMIEAGLNWWQSLLAVFLGNLIVLGALLVNAHAGTRFGIPFPVFARASFGIHGSHVPSLLRSLVACGWFGIQTWIGGSAIHAILGILWPAWLELGGGWRFMDHSLPEFLGFLLFWLLNLYFVYAGTESIKWMETLAAPFLLAIGLALLAWAWARVGSLQVILRESETMSRTVPKESSFQFLFSLYLPWLTAMVGYWATLSLNIPDFTRYARSQKDQMLGQGIGLLTTMPLFAFIGIAVTSASVILYGEAIWNPVVLVTRLVGESQSALLGLAALLALVVATLSTNIAANIVAPANSISALAPGRIGFRKGGYIAGLLGILIVPWKLLDSYQLWLISYSGLLGAVGGVMICDYLVVRRRRLRVDDLYRSDGMYGYRHGVNWRAMAALAAGFLVALLGKLDPRLDFLFNGAWFSATGTSFLLYLFLMKRPLQGSAREG